MVYQPKLRYQVRYSSIRIWQDGGERSLPISWPSTHLARGEVRSAWYGFFAKWREIGQLACRSDSSFNITNLSWKSGIDIARYFVRGCGIVVWPGTRYRGLFSHGISREVRTLHFKLDLCCAQVANRVPLYYPSISHNNRTRKFDLVPS